MSRYDYHKPKSLNQALKLKNIIPDSLYISGGTDLIVRIKKKELNPSALISLRSIPDLSGIENDKIFRIGAMTTISDLLRNVELHKKYPVLIQAAKELGSIQIRNVATIGGNLGNGSPAADMAPPLLVLEAKLRLQNAQKSRDLPVEKFFLGPGATALSPEEILIDIRIDSPEPHTKTIFLKKGRTRMDLGVASVAALIKTEGKRCLKARIAAGSVAPTPMRLSEVESLLEGSSLTKKLIAEAKQLASRSVSPITDVRSSAAYRRHLVGVLVKRALEMLLEMESGDRYLT